MEYAEKESRKPETVKSLLITEVRRPDCIQMVLPGIQLWFTRNFFEKRPEKSEKNNYLFYLSCVPKERIKNEDDSWSYASSMGENCLARLCRYQFHPKSSPSGQTKDIYNSDTI